MPAIVLLTGAGISAESGLETFRSATGLWAEHKIEEVCTPEALARDPAKVHHFYNMRRAALKGTEPNAAHLALAALCREFPDEMLLVTQNVDDLHERAGTPGVLHMHGELLSLSCTRCDHQAPFAGDSAPHTPCPSCQRGELRPDIVFFGEMPRFMERIEAALRRCEIFVAIGTSGHVWPAAGFGQLAAASGAECWLVNLDPPANQRDFQEFFQGKASEQVPELVARLRARLGG